MATESMRLKLLIDSEGEKVLFAEAGKEVVDFLINILSLPIGTVVRLLTKQGMDGCLGILYQSIENISETYIVPNQDKDTFLKPALPNHLSDVPLLLTNTNNPSTNTLKKFYCCSTDMGCRFVAVDSRTRCPSHPSYALDVEMRLVDPPVNPGSPKASNTEKGFVKGVVTYMIMDDLAVSRMSTISSITLLNKFSIKDVSSLQEKVVDLGMDQAVELLKASLQAKTVLTDVFLGTEKKKKDKF